jgi:hypothetical protein
MTDWHITRVGVMVVGYRRFKLLFVLRHDGIWILVPAHCFAFILNYKAFQLPCTSM